MERLLAFPLLALLWIYQKILSPVFYVLGARCRHYPSCSQYSKEAILKHGPWPGVWMSLARLSRCHPFEWLGATSGVDNVPETVTKPPLWAPWRYGRWRGTNSDEG